VLLRPRASELVDAIIRAEEHGVTSIWTTGGGTASDSMTAFAAAAARTHRIQLGTSIVPIYPRHPLMLATQALVIADLAPDRLHLGVGPSHRPTVEGAFGIPFVSPLAYLREYVDVLRQYLWQGQVNVTGKFFSVHATLPQGMEPPRIPLLISALRHNAFHLAGEIADGAITWLCPVPYLVHTALPALEAGAAAAGRPVPPLVAHVPVAAHDDRAAVRHAARSRLATYGKLPFYAAMFADAGFPIAPDGALPDALLDELVVSGSPELILARLAEIRAAGAAIGKHSD
jgi:F420-dependent oxidoreductase-like protein